MSGTPELLLAHPLTEPGGLPVAPALAALYAAAAVFVTVYAVRRRAGEGPETGPSLDPWVGELSPAVWTVRGVAVAVLIVAIAGARLGSTSELENIVPAFVLGAGWPLALLASSLGASWRWIDPVDAPARLFDRRTIQRPADDVAWAAPVALAASWYLSVPVGSLAPRNLGMALGLYALTMLGGALWLGRAWLSRADAFSLLFSWLSRLGRGRLTRWVAPLHADLVLGTFAGGLLFGALRRSALWGDLNTSPQATTYATVGLLFCCAVGATVATQTNRRAEGAGAAGAVPAALLPAVASIGIALALARNRFFVSLQLLPSLISDPFGQGWDLFGTAGGAIDPNPLGTTGLAVTQTVILVLGHLIAAWIYARRAPRRAKPWGAIALAITLAVSVIAISAVGELPSPV